MAEDDGANPDLDDLGDLGDEDDEGASDDLDTDAGDDDGKDANPPADTPAPTAEDWERAQRKLKRQEDRITRLLKAQGKPVTRDAAGNVTEDSDAPAAPAADPDLRVKRQAGIAALTDAGMPRAAAKTAVRLLDLADLDVDDDGEVDEDELDGLVEDLREKFPAMFERSAGAGNGTAKRVPRVRTAPTRAGAPTDDPTARTSRALLRQAGFSVGRGR